MTFKTSLFIVFFAIFIFACAEDTDVTVARNLQEYIDATAHKDLGEVIACAANANGNTSLTYIFYYPKKGATDIRYYEADSLQIDENDFSKYRRASLEIQDVFGGKLQRFLRTSSEENWCLVTYILDGKLHKSNPIRLKNTTKPSKWTDEVAIEYTTKLEPKFTWTDIGITDNEIYFQVISKTQENAFISGTYTNSKTFQYYDTSNVVLDINEEQTPDNLEIDTEYKFTLMAVSKDNWVNLIIEEKLVPGSLQEYLNNNTVNNSRKITSFAANAKGNENLSYIYYYPLTNAREFRFYETEGTNIDENNFANYRRKILTDEAVFGAKLRRFSRENDEESWCIVTYEIDGQVYKSDPIQLKNKTQPTQYETQVEIVYTAPLKPKFTWTDFNTTNALYFKVLTEKTDTFVSGIFTKNKTFQYYDTTNTVSNINTETPPELIRDNQYNFTLMGLSTNNWVNLIIQKSFEVE